MHSSLINNEETAHGVKNSAIWLEGLETELFSIFATKTFQYVF